MLHEVHDVLQAAFGWTDSHLHRFARGLRYFHPDTEYYLCPFDVDEGDEGVPEHEVRLDEVLVEPGGVLFYNYDFGDDWQHVIKLEAVLARDDTMPRAACTGGRRPGPAEDSGGIYGYELIVAATDPVHPEHSEAVAEYRRYYGEDADPAYYRPTSFDLDEINTVLCGFVGAGQEPRADLAAPLRDLVDAVRTVRGARTLRELMAAAGLDEPDGLPLHLAAQPDR
jgi:hypothetical protein